MRRRLFKPPSRDEILSGPALKTMTRIGGPAVLSSLVFTLYNLADAAWIGRLPGDEGLAVMAGIQSSWPFVWFLISLIAGFGGAAVTALVAQNIGANRPREANYALNQLFTVSIFAGFAIGVTGYFISPVIVSLLVDDAAVAAQAAIYLKVIFLGLPTMMLPGLLSFAFSATGDTVTPLLVNLIGTGLNVLLDPLLILGWGPFAQMGILGAAYATLAAQGVSTVIFVALFLRGQGPLRLDSEALRLNARWLSKALRIGLPAAIGQSSVAFGFMIVIGVIGRLDNPAAALAGYGVADRVFGMLFIATDGLGVGLTTMVGQALGALKMDRARELVKKGLLALFSIVLVEAAFLYIIRRPLISAFLPGQADAIREGARFIELFAAGMPFLSAFFAAQAIYRGSGHNIPTMILGILRLWILRIPLSYTFAFVAGMQSDGVWLGMSLSNVIAGLAAVGFIVSRSWQRSVIEPVEEPVSSS